MRQRNTPRGMVDRRDLEVCVFNYVAALLRAGDLAIAGADSYADYREQLLRWAVCQSRLPDYCAKVEVPETGKGLVAALREELTEVAGRVDRLLPELKDEISISAKGEPVLKRVQAREIRSSSVALQANLNRRLTTRNLLDILANMERWTRFTRGFGPASGKDPKRKGAATRYLQTLFAMGCNLGPTQASKHFASHVTPHMLSFVHRRHMSLEQLEGATRDLTELYLRLDLPKMWGDGKAVAADGTQYDFYDNNLLAGYHFRYRKMGAVAYRHVANNYIAVSRHFIPPGIWEAVYVIEGLMKAGLSVEADAVYSDTQGQSASVFAFTYLMGIQLMPRIRNWKDLTFFRPDRKSRYQNIDQLFGEAIQWDVIEAGHQELMQVVLSIQAGHLASPTLLRKLSYGGTRNHLFAAAHEVGRAVRTIFLLKWISKLQLRQEVTANTNKIESYNGFAKWFSFGGDVIPENDPEEQQKRLRYNDLVAACVILQNAVDMMKALEDLTAEGQRVDMADVRFLSPYATSHVKRFGDYRLDLGKPAESWLSEATFREALNQSRQRPAASAKP
jgi:TnpA family transposase